MIGMAETLENRAIAAAFASRPYPADAGGGDVSTWGVGERRPEQAPSGTTPPTPAQHTPTPEATDATNSPLIYGTGRDLPGDQFRCISQAQCGKGAIVQFNRLLGQARILPLRCKSWDCDFCGPTKRRAAIRKMAAGKPTVNITLTSTQPPGESILERAKRMKLALRKLAALIRRELKRHPALRWRIPLPTKDKKLADLRSLCHGIDLTPFLKRKTILSPLDQRRLITQAHAARNHPLIWTQKAEFEYALCWELAGERHLHAHALARTQWIDQAWLSHTWNELGIGKIVWVKQARAIKVLASHHSKSITSYRQDIEQDEADYAIQEVSQTAPAIEGLRVIQFSTGYAVDRQQIAHDHLSPGWVSSFTHTTAADILAHILRVNPDCTYAIDEEGNTSLSGIQEFDVEQYLYEKEARQVA